MNKAELTAEVEYLRRAVDKLTSSLGQPSVLINRTPTKSALVAEYVNNMPLQKEVGLYDVERSTGVSGLALFQAIRGLREQGYISISIGKTEPMDEAYLAKKRHQTYTKRSKKWQGAR